MGSYAIAAALTAALVSPCHGRCVRCGDTSTHCRSSGLYRRCGTESSGRDDGGKDRGVAREQVEPGLTGAQRLDPDVDQRLGLGRALGGCVGEVLLPLRRLAERELGFAEQDGPTLTGLFRQQYRGGRYSWGYPACPDLTDNAKVAELLEASRIGVSVSEGFQLHPEQTTDAIICHHPMAKYFVA